MSEREDAGTPSTKPLPADSRWTSSSSAAVLIVFQPLFGRSRR